MKMVWEKAMMMFLHSCSVDAEDDAVDDHCDGVDVLDNKFEFEKMFFQPIFSVELGTSVWCLTFGLPATHGS